MGLIYFHINLDLLDDSPIALINLLQFTVVVKPVNDRFKAVMLDDDILDAVVSTDDVFPPWKIIDEMFLLTPIEGNDFYDRIVQVFPVSRLVPWDPLVHQSHLNILW